MASLSFPAVGQMTGNLPNLHFIVGRIVLDSTTPTVAAGKGFTVAKTATGRYTITLNKKVKIITTVGQLAKPASEAIWLRKPVWDNAVEGAKKVEFATENASQANTDAASTDQVEFIIVCMTTTSLPA